jgi:hypothetical protein
MIFAHAQKIALQFRIENRAGPSAALQNELAEAWKLADTLQK